MGKNFAGDLGRVDPHSRGSSMWLSQEIRTTTEFRNFISTSAMWPNGKALDYD